MSLYVFDASRLDTTLGAPSQMFSPPQGWEGDNVAYLSWLRSQFKSSHCFRQRLGCAARSSQLNRPPYIEGLFSKTLIFVINSLNRETKRTTV